MNKTHVLIMEYEDRVSRVLCRIIRHLGLEPLSADNYSNFKELYHNNQPHLILMSLDTPNNNQGEICRYLIDENSRANIILLSNMDEERLLSFEYTGRSAGLNIGGILRKPVDMNSVQTKLEEIISSDQGNPGKKKVISVLLTLTEWLLTGDPAGNTHPLKTGYTPIGLGLCKY